MLLSPFLDVGAGAQDQPEMVVVKSPPISGVALFRERWYCVFMSVRELRAGDVEDALTPRSGMM